MRNRRPGMAHLILILLPGIPACTGPPPARVEEHDREIREWRAQRLERLQGETGWLSLAGLHWLKEGENRFGTDPANDAVLPAGTAPAHAGSFILDGNVVRVRAAPGANLTLGGEPVEEREIRTDEEGEPDLLRLDGLYLYVLKRGDRYGVRVKNPDSPVRTEFPGLEYFPIDYSYRFDAEFVPFETPREIPIADVLGMVNDRMVPGVVKFTRNGETMSLLPLVQELEDRRFFIIFADPTNGRETYGAGRYLYADLEEDGSLVLDFNKAYNPPCAFTPYATCPLPPRENRLAVRIEAGEKKFSDH